MNIAFLRGSSFSSLRGVFLQNEDPTDFYVLESNKLKRFSGGLRFVV